MPPGSLSPCPSPSPSASALARATPPDRDRAIDALRVAALAVVMVGHTLMATVEPGGRVGNVLVVLPQAQAATWLFQVVPVFFLVGGFAHAATLDGHHRPSYGAFVASRAARLLPPAALLVALWFAAGLALELTGHDSGLPRAAARVAVQPLWFLGVYVGLVALAPAMYRLHQRLGLRVVVVLAAATGTLDVLRFSSPAPAGGGIPPLAYATTATVWLAVHSLGFALRDGTLDRFGVPLAVGGLATAAALVVAGPYPTSMVGLPGAPVSNMSPPTLVLLAHAVWLTGLVVLVRPALRRRLAATRPWTVVVAANGVCMTAFLWHLTALFAVLAFAPQPIVGSTGWWATRPLVVAGTGLGTVVLVAAFRSVERRAPLPVRSSAVAATGAAAASAGLLAVSATGAVGALSGRTAHLAGVPVTLPLAGGLLAGGCLLLGVVGRGRDGTCGRTTPTPSDGS